MNQKVTYEPDNCLKKGYRAIFSDIFIELMKNKWLTYQLFKRDFFAMYKQSLMGFFWAFIIPIVSIGTFVALNRSGVFSVGDIDAPYPIYALLGLTFWQLFSTGLLASSNALVKAGPMIVKINFSKKSLVIASCGQALVSFAIQVIFLGIFFLAYKTMPSFKLFFIPFMLIPLMLFTLGLGLIFSLINGVMRDIGNTLSIIITFLMFLTPVLYAKPETGLLADITKYNPLYYLISVPRDLVLTGAVLEWRGFLLSSILACAITAGCFIIFHLTETRVTERV